MRCVSAVHESWKELVTVRKQCGARQRSSRVGDCEKTLSLLIRFEPPQFHESVVAHGSEESLSFRIPSYGVNVFIVRFTSNVDEVERRRVLRIRSLLVFLEYPDRVIAGRRGQKSGQMTPRDAVNGAIVSAGNGTNALPRFGVFRTDGERVFFRVIRIGVVGDEFAPDFEAFIIADAD